jgi:hypothetical protein
MSRSTSSSSSPVVTATSSSLMMGATWAPVSSSAAAEDSSSSAGRCSAGSAMASGAAVAVGALGVRLPVCYRSLRVAAAAAERREVSIKLRGEVWGWGRRGRKGLASGKIQPSRVARPCVALRYGSNLLYFSFSFSLSPGFMWIGLYCNDGRRLRTGHLRARI